MKVLFIVKHNFKQLYFNFKKKSGLDINNGNSKHNAINLDDVRREEQFRLERHQRHVRLERVQLGIPQFRGSSGFGNPRKPSGNNVINSKCITI